jgi:hypothetical protein
MKLMLVLAAVAAATSSGLTSAPALARGGCVVPRLYALKLGTAKGLLTHAGCTLAGVSYQRPRAGIARITAQVPPPGAMLPASARVFLIVS